MSIGEQVAVQTATVESAQGSLRAAGLLYGATIFLSAFLLFLVQPIIGKIILPWFGGSAGVWAACLLYFQASLLVGYAYAHGLRRFLSLKLQVRIHLLLLAGSIALLPILPSPEWRHGAHIDPALRILALLAGTIGLPYLVICATSPLLQAWYAAIKPGSSPYRLYALSNLGSMLGLLCFPVLVEPHLSSRVQAWDWSGAYIIFAVLCGLAGWYANQKQDLQRRGKEGAEVLEEQLRENNKESLSRNLKPTLGIQLLWIALAACGSALMMSVTNYLSQNIAPIPLLWILPLGLYLLSFVLCFDTDKIYQRLIWIPLMLLGLGAMAWTMFYHGGTTNLKRAIPLMLIGLFSCCMMCHGELARHKPAPRYLTYFYLLTSAGGVLGGFFVAIIAPRIFRTYVELPLWMVICALLGWGIVWARIADQHWILRVLLRGGMGGFAVVLAAYMVIQKHGADQRFYMQVRNFYGTLQLRNFETGDEDGRVRTLQHGIIEHGAQLLDPKDRHEPTLYYVRTSGVGMALRYVHGRARGVRVGAIGLGAGVLASYCQIGDMFEFYEINPAVVKIANSEFTFLHDCPGKANVQLGDARLTLEGQPSQEFDVLAVDAFSGDAIPIHLITREAFIEYFRHLKRDGILAIHVSNKYLDLVPVVARIADDLHKTAIAVYDTGDGSYPSDSDWVLVATKPEIFDAAIFQADTVEGIDVNPRIALWTDDFSNVLQIMNLGQLKDEDDTEEEEP